MKAKTVIQPKEKEDQQPKIMKVWSFNINEFDYSGYFMPNGKDREFFDKIGKPAIMRNELVGKEWKPLIFIKKKQRKNPDFLSIAGVGIVMTQRAIDALKPLIKDSVEILPLKSLRQPMYFVNILESLDCLDEEKTVFRLSAVTKKKVGITKFAFDSDKIHNKHLFKIKGFWYNTFVSDEFQKICKEHDLQGVDFTAGEMVWKHTVSHPKKDNKENREQDESDSLWDEL